MLFIQVHSLVILHLYNLPNQGCTVLYCSLLTRWPAGRMPPVDAVYRPHVVHHTIVPPEVKAQQTRSKTKRYFAAE